MAADSIEFTVREVEAVVPAGFPVEIEGRRVSSGPVAIRLDDEAPAGASAGVLDYRTGTARVTFRVRVEFPEIAQALRWAGLEGTAVAPARGTLESAGDILPDHSFALSGRFAIGTHDFLSAESLVASVLPGT